MVSLRVRKASTLACSRCEASVSFSSSACSWRVLGGQVGLLLLHAGAAGQGLAGEVLAAGGERLPALPLELVGLLLELLELQLEALARGRDVGHAAAHLLQHLELALVGVVEGLARVLGAVERLVGLGTEDQLEPLHDAHRTSGTPFVAEPGRVPRAHPRTDHLPLPTSIRPPEFPPEFPPGPTGGESLTPGSAGPRRRYADARVRTQQDLRRRAGRRLAVGRRDQGRRQGPRRRRSVARPSAAVGGPWRRRGPQGGLPPRCARSSARSGTRR